MIVLSLFDGKSCGMVALQRAGIKVTAYFASEIDKAAIKVSKANYPKIIQIGNVEKVRYVKGMLFTENGSFYVGKVDLLIGGSPCQGFSFAGRQLNFEDPRSKLFFEYIRIKNQLQAVNPDLLFLLENVKMAQRSKEVITEYTGVDPILINGALVSGQNRERLYWTNINGVKQPADRKIRLADILVPADQIPAKYIHTEKALAYMDRTVKGGRSHWDFAHHSSEKDAKSKCVTANLHKGVPYNVLVMNNGLVRKFLPVECERLQGLPDGYTAAAVSDTQRYKILGNGWQVDVIEYIFSYL